MFTGDLAQNEADVAMIVDFDVLDRAPTRVGRAVLVVRDLDLVAGFYRRVIGLAVLGRDERGLHLGAGGRLLLTWRHEPTARVASAGDPGLYHLAFLLPARDDLGAWLAYVQENAVAIDGVADHFVSDAVYLSDPEGNGVEVYADRPRDAWRWHDGQVEMTTEPLDVTGLLRDTASQGGFGGSWAGAPAGTRIGHVHLRVGDVALAVRFYAGQLGLDPVSTWRGALLECEVAAAQQVG